MAFERYVKNRRQRRPTASLWQRGQIGLNQGAVHQFRLGDYTRVVLFFERETQRIGLQFTKDDVPESVTLTHGTTGVCFAARQFLHCYGIAYRETRRYPIAFDDTSGLYIIDLQHPLSSYPEEPAS